MEKIEHMTFNIEREFINFCQKNSISLNFSDIEFFGMNFSDDNDEVTFKIYHRTKKDSLKNIPFFCPLYEHNMINSLNIINDNVNNDKIRCEIGLKNRTNDNMCWLYRWIMTQFFLEKNFKNEIRKLTNLKCCGLPNYQYASMYFIGFIISSDIIEPKSIDALKLHYILRYCENPDDIGHNFLIDNKQSIVHLKNMGLPVINSIITMIEYLIKDTDMEIWMVAIDHYRNGIVKYKIYIKKLQDILYEKLFFYLKKNSHITLANKILSYSKWIKSHPNFEKYGMAICCTNSGIWSVNFYH